MHTLADEHTRAAILHRLRTLRSEAPRRWGRMSAHQMVCHLADACRMAIGDRPVSGTPNMVGRTLLKWSVLYVPIPWPPGVPTNPELDQRCSGTPPSDFARDLEDVETQLQRLTERRDTAGWPPHPVFGAMSRADWMRWAYLHTDHHLRQFGV